MQKKEFILVNGKVTASISEFEGENTQLFALLKHNSFATNDETINDLADALTELPIEGKYIVFKRLYASDIHNTAYYSNKFAHAKPGDYSAMSFIQQCPLSSSRNILFVYAIKGEVATCVDESFTYCEHGGYREVWSANLEASVQPNSYQQTKHIFKKLSQGLSFSKMTIPKNLVRTWLYVNNVDKNYSGVVQARKEFFSVCGMNKDTHYVASTGIEGTSPNLPAYVSMDSVSIGNLKDDKVEYISATNNLNPTHEYGVTFERASVINYGDRRHFYLSGTASINNKGEVVHVGDVRMQAERTTENIEALMNSANFEWSQMAYFIVYLRDLADYPIVKDYLAKTFGNTPYVVVEGPVCRPDWLIEIEGEGVQEASLPFPKF